MCFGLRLRLRLITSQGPPYPSRSPRLGPPVRLDKASASWLDQLFPIFGSRCGQPCRLLWAALQLRSERDSLLVATATNSMEMEMQAEAGEVALEGEVMAEQTFSPRAQLDPRTVEISAPRGQLGLVFDRGSTTLAKVKGSSPLSNLVQVGWALVAVNDVDVSYWCQTCGLLRRRGDAGAAPGARAGLRLARGYSWPLGRLLGTW